MTYPCQKAALANSAVLFSSILPAFAAVQRRARSIGLKWILTLAISAIFISGTSYFILTSYFLQKESVSLSLSPQQASSAPASEVYVANGTITELVNLMGSKGLMFYKSETGAPNSGPEGLFSNSDVIIIKVNCQWDQRGGTNTDLLKELIQLLLDHPDGFVGEIVVADNGQGRGSLNWPRSNAANESQSAEAVVSLYSGEHKVSTYLWDKIASTEVQEYDLGDLRDGYIVSPNEDHTTGVRTSYPKFRTAKGTYISFKYGVWDPATKTYDSGKLKIINFPVLKSHSIYGVTAAVKHYMGVISQPLTNTHDYVGRGALGKVMAETRVPTLNILDAVWINAIPGNGPDTTYGEATRTNLVLASTDPVALDYWASKHILLQTATLKRYANSETLDPDGQSAFGTYLRNSMEQLAAAGYEYTMDESRITVYIAGVTQG
ncbi:MAG: DUF362 domain-containing protein [Candidatus Brockarchaeota archaeon]|nr:DUF362 domain-containing protein [Candidatus Brockarchaeota archaeon]